MLVQPTVEKLYSLKLGGMAKALEEQFQTQDMESLSFEGRFGLLVDREMTERRNRKLGLRLKKAKLRLNASVGQYTIIPQASILSGSSVRRYCLVSS
jgi:hypothetical protein